MLLLGIETSCDETAAAVVADGRRILSNVISSQVEVHARYGGVVPEVASRQHMLAMTPIYHQALREAGVAPDDLDGISVTAGPGLAGSLLVGVNYAKGLAMGLGLPLYGMNHLEGHMYAAWLEEGPTPEEAVGFPLVCLLVSGGHTELVLMRGHGDYHHLGGTRDDAAGEAFDKAARVMGLGFPGGPAIQREAQAASSVEPLPRAWMRGTLEFSFSGLKTATLHRARELGVAMGLPDGPESLDEAGIERRRALAAGFQEAAVDVLVGKTLDAARQFEARGVLVGGGVSANAALARDDARPLSRAGAHPASGPLHRQRSDDRSGGLPRRGAGTAAQHRRRRQPQVVLLDDVSLPTHPLPFLHGSVYTHLCSRAVTHKTLQEEM